MNPWKIIGWIVLVGIVLMLGTCGVLLFSAGKTKTLQPANQSAHSAVPQSNRVPNSYRLFVVSVECTSRGRDRADITVRNDGNTPMRFAKAFAVFKNKSGEVMSAQDSFFHPTDIPPGATASADVYSNGSGAYSCALLSVQDNNGIAAQLMM